MIGRQHQHVRTGMCLLAMVVCTSVPMSIEPLGWAVPGQKRGTQAQSTAEAGFCRLVACSAKAGIDVEMGPRALTRKIRTTSTPKEVFGIIATYGGDFDEVHLVTCLRQLAAMKNLFTQDLAESQVFADLLFCLNYNVGVMDPFSLSNTAWSLAQLSTGVEIGSSDLLRSIAIRTTGTISEFSQKSLSSLVWAFGELSYRDEAMMQAVARRVCEVVNSLDLRGMRNLAWGFAELQFDDEEFMQGLAQHAIRKMGQLTLRDMGTVAASFTRLNRTHNALSRAMTSTLAKRGWEGGENPWFDVARVFLASSRAKLRDGPFLGLIDRKLDRPALSALGIYDVAAMLWASRELQCQTSYPNMFAKLESAAQRRGISWKDIDRSNLVDPL